MIRRAHPGGARQPRPFAHPSSPSSPLRQEKKSRRRISGPRAHTGPSALCIARAVVVASQSTREINPCVRAGNPPALYYSNWRWSHEPSLHSCAIRIRFDDSTSLSMDCIVLPPEWTGVFFLSDALCILPEFSSILCYTAFTESCQSSAVSSATVSRDRPPICL